jgi:hypothetical protein
MIAFSMSSQTITHHPIPNSLPSAILESLPRPNFAALFVLAVVVFIWWELSPIWLPPAAWLISLFAPIFWFLCEVLVAVAGALIFSFALVVITLLMSGATPSYKGS